jgi:hypothetical protein
MANLTASGEAKFEITAAADVSNRRRRCTGDFPVSGESLSVSTTDAGSVIVTKSGTVSNQQSVSKVLRLVNLKLQFQLKTH